MWSVAVVGRVPAAFVCAAVCSACGSDPIQHFAQIPEGDWAVLIFVPEPGSATAATVIPRDQLDEAAIRIEPPGEFPPLIVGLENSSLPLIHHEIDPEQLGRTRWIANQSGLTCFDGLVSETSVSVPVDERFSIFELSAELTSFREVSAPSTLDNARVELPLRFGVCLGIDPNLRPVPFGASERLLTGTSSTVSTELIEIFPINSDRLIVRLADGLALVDRGGGIDRSSDQFFNVPGTNVRAAAMRCEGACRQIIVQLTPTQGSTVPPQILTLAIEDAGFRAESRTELPEMFSDIELDPRSDDFFAVLQPSTFVSAPSPHGPYTERPVPATVTKLLATSTPALPPVVLYGVAGGAAVSAPDGMTFREERIIKADFGGTRADVMLETLQPPAIWAGGRNGELRRRDEDGTWEEVEYILPPYADVCASTGTEFRECGRLFTAEWIRSITNFVMEDDREFLVWNPDQCTALFVFDPETGCMAALPGIYDEPVHDKNAMSTVARLGDSLFVGGQEGLLVELKL